MARPLARRALPRAVLLRRRLALAAEFLDFGFRQVFDADKSVVGLACPYQLVEFHLYRRTVTVLGVLDEENHEEGDDGRSSVDNELPCVGKAEQGAVERPDRDHQTADDEGDGRAGGMRDAIGDPGELFFE